ncbi:MAG: heme-binding protein [Nitrospira sp.]|nr:heme-binding protein [Nitrospira sp.]
MTKRDESTDNYDDGRKMMKMVQRWLERREQPGRGLIVGAMICLQFGGIAASSALAQEIAKESVLPLSLANKAIAAAIESCKKDGYRVSVSVVDRSGVLRAMGRADGAGPHTVDSSRKKAYTAASIRRPTTELADLIGKNPALQGLRDMNNEILILGGGLPIEIGGEIVGGIGVGGAPGAHLDDACAQSGLDAIGAAPKVTVPK